MLQIEQQKEENRDNYSIELDNIEVVNPCLEILRDYPVEELWMANNNLTIIPEGIFKLNTLRHLSIQRNPNISTISQSISELKNLERLWILGSDISTLPDGVFKLKNLTQLIVTSNQLTSVSDSLRNLSELEFLDLGNNKIAHGPKAIRELKKLKILYLNGNPSIDFSETIITASNLSLLQRLYLHNNNYRTIPDNLHLLNDLKDLKQLNLQNNLFTQVQKDSIREILRVEIINF
jgi:internalin A